MKILSPAGNFESLKTAIFNGADEVYLGVNDFNARNNVEGFNMDNLKNAVDFAHVYSVKVLLAINILFSNEEMQSAVDVVVDAYNIGVDAFIVQDLGLISILSKNYPQIELHASTQMGLHNLEGVKEIAKFGVKRVVLARETPLSEIKRIKDNIDIEIEYFAHGALCVSFSGNCYLSSCFHNASGNRGRCKQLCRLPFSFFDGEKMLKKGYLLSAKDFNMLERLSELEKAGVDVLKIEGRARRAYYVGTITSAYRLALKGEKVKKEDIELAFNRTFTEGYFNGNGQIISSLQNHIGVLIGRVEKVNNGKNFNEIIVNSSARLSPKSTFKFYSNEQENNTITAYDLTQIDKARYRITTTQKVNVGDSVRLIVDAQKEQDMLKFSKRKQLEIKLEFLQNRPAKATVYLDGEKLEIFGETCLPAINRPISNEEILDNFSKSEFFEIKLKQLEIEKVFLTKQKLNEFRRKVFNLTEKTITEKYIKTLEKLKVCCQDKGREITDFSIATKGFEKVKAQTVIYSPEEYRVEDIERVKTAFEKEGKNFYLDTPNFATKEDIELLKKIVEKTGVKIVANNYYALSLNAQKIIGWGLNVYNNYTASELALAFIKAENNEKFNPPYMTLRHCPIKTHAGGDCSKCKYHKNYAYKMESGRVLKLRRKKLSSCTFYLTD